MISRDENRSFLDKRFVSVTIVTCLLPNYRPIEHLISGAMIAICIIFLSISIIFDHGGFLHSFDEVFLQREIISKPTVVSDIYGVAVKHFFSVSSRFSHRCSYATPCTGLCLNPSFIISSRIWVGSVNSSDRLIPFLVSSIYGTFRNVLDPFISVFSSDPFAHHIHLCPLETARIKNIIVLALPIVKVDPRWRIGAQNVAFINIWFSDIYHYSVN